MSLTLSPSEIRYSQNSISQKFSDGRLLTSTFARLVSGQLNVSSLPALKCSNRSGNWFAASGNRRLFLYKKLQEAGVISTITVLKSSNTGGRNFTTKCDGVYIQCRGSPLEYQIQEIIAQWKRGEDVVAKWGTAPVSPPVANSYMYHGEFDFDDVHACGYDSDGYDFDFHDRYDDLLHGFDDFDLCDDY